MTDKKHSLHSTLEAVPCNTDNLSHTQFSTACGASLCKSSHLTFKSFQDIGRQYYFRFSDMCKSWSPESLPHKQLKRYCHLSDLVFFAFALFQRRCVCLQAPLQPIWAIYLDAISNDNNKTHHSAGTTQHISSHPRSGWIHPCLASETRQDWAVLELWLELLGYLSDKMEKKTFAVMLRLRKRFYFSGKTMGTKDKAGISISSLLLCLGKCAVSRDGLLLELWEKGQESIW